MVYRQWVCSSLFPFITNTTAGETGQRRRYRPCRSVCQAVEQHCPYFLPENLAPALLTQYAGEPTFLCLDPNIPEIGEQLDRSLYPSDQFCCVRRCPKSHKMCIEKREACEDSATYANATASMVHCNASDTLAARIPVSQCPTYNSPYHLGSGTSSSLRPITLLLAASVTTSRPNNLYLPVVFLVFYLTKIPFQINAMYVVMYYFFTREYRVARWKNEVKVVLNFTKIFNYFRFSTKKWQYYFILISVNLLLCCCYVTTNAPFVTPLDVCEDSELWPGLARGCRTLQCAHHASPIIAQMNGSGYSAIQHSALELTTPTVVNQNSGLVEISKDVIVCRSRRYRNSMSKCLYAFSVIKKYSKNYNKKRFKMLMIRNKYGDGRGMQRRSGECVLKCAPSALQNFLQKR